MGGEWGRAVGTGSGGWGQEGEVVEGVCAIVKN